MVGVMTQIKCLTATDWCIQYHLCSTYRGLWECCSVVKTLKEAGTRVLISSNSRLFTYLYVKQVFQLFTAQWPDCFVFMDASRCFHVLFLITRRLWHEGNWCQGSGDRKMDRWGDQFVRPSTRLQTTWLCVLHSLLQSLLDAGREVSPRRRSVPYLTIATAPYVCECVYTFFSHQSLHHISRQVWQIFPARQTKEGRWL